MAASTAVQVPYISIDVEFKNTRARFADVFRVLFVVSVCLTSLSLFGVGPVWYACCAWSLSVVVTSFVAAVVRTRSYTSFYNIKLFWDEAGSFTIQQADTVIFRSDNTALKAMLAADMMVENMMNMLSVISNKRTKKMIHHDFKGTIALYAMPNLETPCMLSVWDDGVYERIVQHIQENLEAYMNMLSTTSAYAPTMLLQDDVEYDPDEQDESGSDEDVECAEDNGNDDGNGDCAYGHEWRNCRRQPNRACRKTTSYAI